MSFDLLAPHYRWMEFVLAGNKLQQCRTAYLAEIRGAQRVLLLGEGNGRFLTTFVSINRSASVTVVDASVEMLRQSKRRARALGERANPERIHYVHADVLQWSPPLAGFDLIVTHFFLDCFRADQLAVLIPVLARAADDDARWIISDFRLPDRGVSRWRARWILTAMYQFFRIMTRIPARHLSPVDDLLDGVGFTLCERRTSEWGLLHSDLWARKEPKFPLPRSHPSLTSTPPDPACAEVVEAEKSC